MIVAGGGAVGAGAWTLVEDLILACVAQKEMLKRIVRS
jgi:hypothetical protein